MSYDSYETMSIDMLKLEIRNCEARIIEAQKHINTVKEILALKEKEELEE